MQSLLATRQRNTFIVIHVTTLAKHPSLCLTHNVARLCVGRGHIVQRNEQFCMSTTSSVFLSFKIGYVVSKLFDLLADNNVHCRSCIARTRRNSKQNYRNWIPVWRWDEKLERANRNKISIVAVSYTHLDVYKRQAHIRPITTQFSHWLWLS